MRVLSVCRVNIYWLNSHRRWLCMGEARLFRVLSTRFTSHPLLTSPNTATLSIVIFHPYFTINLYPSWFSYQTTFYWDHKAFFPSLFVTWNSEPSSEVTNHDPKDTLDPQRWPDCKSTLMNRSLGAYDTLHSDFGDDCRAWWAMGYREIQTDAPEPSCYWRSWRHMS